MFIFCNLAVLVLVLNFNGRVHAGSIIGGQEAKPHSRPYMVLVEKRSKCDKITHCGGFLLNEDFVMTAAHCQAESYNVLLGFNYYYAKQKLNISVKQAFPYKDYNDNGYINDIMLLKLSSKIKFTNKVKPIALGDHITSLPKSCSVAGWGQISLENEQMSLQLKEVNVTLIEKEECTEKHAFCSEGKEGPGRGDSGGPLVCEDGRAYGVVSASSSMIYKYTKIADYRDWIDIVMNNL